MGNRTFLYTTDRLPDPAQPQAKAPQAVAGIAEANNWLPPLWRVLLGASVPGPAQDMQQVFLPSLCGGIYAPRPLAEERMFRLLDFIAGDPELPEPEAFRAQVEALRSALAEVEGEAYCADLNEWYALDADGSVSPDSWLDQFAADCARCWEKAECAMEAENHGAVARLYEFDSGDAARMLGFECWDILDSGDDGDDEDDDGDGSRGIDLGAGMEQVAENGKVGVYNRYTEKLVVPPILDDVFCYEEGVAVAVLDGRYGYLDMDGDWLVEPVYDDAYDFSGGMGQVERGGLTGYVNAAGEEAVAPRFLADSGPFVAAGFAPVQLAEGFGVIDRAGTLVAPAIHGEIEWVDSLGAWQTTLDGECVVLHADGRQWFRGAFDSVWGLSPDGDAVVEREGKLGTWQRNGAPGLPLEFDDIDEFQAFASEEEEGERLYVAAFGEGRKARKGLYRADGECLIPAEFSRVSSVPVQHRTETTPIQTAGDFFLVKRHDGGARGVWSRAANGPVLPFELRLARGVATARGVFLVALRADGSWILADAGGQALNEHRYDWVVNPGYADGNGWTMPIVLSDIAQAWDQDRPVPAGRGGQTCHVGSNGVEESEFDYLLRATREAPPIKTPRGALKRLFARDKDHVIEGVGDPESCARLGDMYAAGEGVEVDPEAALRWYATAASGGHEGARYQYAYYLATGTGCKADPAAAREQFTALGDDGRALVMLGYLHEKGLGGAADPVQARACYERAAGNDTSAWAEGQFRAGNCWRFGIGGPVDDRKALGYFELAAERTPHRHEAHPEATWAAAQINAALAREAHEAGDAKLHALHRKRALRYYGELVELGDNGGLLGLARCHLGDYGGKVDRAKGLAFLDQAAGTDAADEARAIREEHGLD